MTLLDTATTTPAPPLTPQRATRRRRGTATLTGYLFVAPNLLLLALFLFVPLGWAVLMSFQDVTSFGTSSWAGLGNYRTLLSDGTFWRVLVNSLIFAVCTVPLSVGAGLVLAHLLNRALPARGLLRTIIYLPIVISGLVTSLVGLLLFDEGVGVINGVLRALGGDGASWQTSGGLAMASVVIMTLWTRIGFAMVIYLAALQDVPPDIQEAAMLDGASSRQRLRFIIVPVLRGATVFLIVVNTIWSVQVFDVVYVMTGGGPGNSTSMLVTYGYDQGFGPARQLGYGATIGLVLLLLTLVITVFQLRSERKA